LTEDFGDGSTALKRLKNSSLPLRFKHSWGMKQSRQHPATRTTPRGWPAPHFPCWIPQVSFRSQTRRQWRALDLLRRYHLQDKPL